MANQQHHMHNAGMPSITIRDVPEETRDELAARAARSGRSLQEYLRTELIEIASKPDMDAVLQRVRARLKASENTVTSEQIVKYIREARGE